MEGAANKSPAEMGGNQWKSGGESARENRRGEEKLPLFHARETFVLGPCCFGNSPSSITFCARFSVFFFPLHIRWQKVIHGAEGQGCVKDGGQMWCVIVQRRKGLTRFHIQTASEIMDNAKKPHCMHIRKAREESWHLLQLGQDLFLFSCFPLRLSDFCSSGLLTSFPSSLWRVL